MFKFVCILIFIAVCCEGIILNKNKNENKILNFPANGHQLDFLTGWQDHVHDFIDLINLEKLLSTVLRFVDDPEVMRFIGFFLSPKFKEMVWELESMDEFKEAYLFLISKGYDLKPVIDTVNSGLTLPVYNRPSKIISYKSGMSEFIPAMFGALPIEDMKKLLEDKVEKYPEVADFLKVLNSEEFRGIMNRMITSSKFDKFKSIFEDYGVDFALICQIFQEFFCEDVICKRLNDKMYL